MDTHLTPDTIARRLQEWERFFLTGHESHAADAADLNAFEGDYCPDMLMAAALDTPDAYVRMLANRCDALASRWMARQTEREERSEHAARAVTLKELETALPGSAQAGQGASGNVYDLWTGQRVQ